MHEALAEVRRQLGPNAIVLHTKRIRKHGWLPIGQKETVEIIAAVDTKITDEPQPVLTAAASKISPDELKSAAVELELKRHVVAGLKCSNPSGLSLSEPAERLVRRGVPEVIVNIVTDNGYESDVTRILQRISRIIRCSGPVALGDEQVRIAIVGPTGVGKTTTVAKLAAEYSLNQGKRVTIVTTDNQRIGGKEQIASYARIMGIPIEVALDPEAVSAIVSAHANDDLILVDTHGVSQRDSNQVSKLAEFVKATDPTETHLVLSASADGAAQLECFESFACMQPNRLILSKVDECVKPGCVLRLAMETLLPFSYVTCGQDVPEDIHVAKSDELALAIWNGTWQW